MKNIFKTTSHKLGKVSKVLAVATLAAGISMANAADTIKSACCTHYLELWQFLKQH